MKEDGLDGAFPLGDVGAKAQPTPRTIHRSEAAAYRVPTDWLRPAFATTLSCSILDFVDRWSVAIVNNDVDQIGLFITNDWTLIDTGGLITESRILDVVADGSLPKSPCITMWSKFAGRQRLP
ncbi:MAG: hypothetical protein L0H96_22875 [Humibacillus sp.]|nr:hypothetical protein [Humibacillus sp.]MDN5779735.1 hypothetical protein [Humibacillus sp.]